MKKIRLLLFIVLSTFLNHAQAEQKNFSAFVGFGELYNFHSVRIGVSSWEFGKMNNGIFAVAKNLYIGKMYASFGPAITTGGAGIYAGLGVDYTFFNFLYLKGEVNAANSFTNYSAGSALVGLGAYW